jgi:hypothetical protein
VAQELVDAIGLPTRDAALALVRSLEQRLWRPGASLA